MPRAGLDYPGSYGELRAWFPDDAACLDYLDGYSPRQALPDVREFLLPRDAAPKQVRPLDSFGANWRGFELAFTRLCLGFDGSFIEELQAGGMTPATLTPMIGQLEMPVVHDGMPTQDAVDYAKFVLNTTIGYTRVRKRRAGLRRAAADRDDRGR